MVSTSQRSLFDRMLDALIASLPDDLHELLEEVPLIVEDEPGDDLLAEMGMQPGEDLCGLHSGVPLTERSVGGHEGLPDHMMVFRGPVIRLAGVRGSRMSPTQRAELERQIRITVLHEIGHHFGLDEDDLAKLGYD